MGELRQADLDNLVEEAIVDAYLAWLSAYGVWERDEDAFDDEDEGEAEPPVPAGLGSLTAPQRALADFLRLDSDLLEVAAEAARQGVCTNWPRTRRPPGPTPKG